jgi:PEP-CTERM motif
MRMHWGVKMPILVALAVLGIVSRAQADPITWTLVGVTSLGTTITGSFVYDADTSTYSAIDITTTGGAIITDTTWSNLAGTHYTGGSLLLVDTSAANDTGADVLGLILTDTLTNAGGMVTLEYTLEGVCAVSDCLTAYPDNPYTNFDVTGAVVSSVPEPGTLMLLATGLLGLGGTIKRKFSALRSGV